jgi:cytochrome b pre-mRNA-processing protein 3
MLRFLFPRLTPPPARGSALFSAIVAEARRPDWYARLGIADTIDGRFSVLATITALVSIRLEQGGEQAQAATVGLTERFIEAMDAEHRQLGLGDPTLGKVVRKLVGALGRRVDLWRAAAEPGGDWSRATEESLEGPVPSGTAEELRTVWDRLRRTSDENLIAGHLE